MKKKVILLSLFVWNSYAGETQKPAPAYQKVDRCVQEYMQLSRLGPGYSRDISDEILDQFNALFERDAFLYWDLYKSNADSLPPPLPLGAYLDRARKTYHPKQPILDYPEVKIGIHPDGKHATVYIKKINQIMDDDDHPLHKNKMKLQININLNRERPLIQNIFEDDRVSFFKSMAFGVNSIVWSNIFSSVTNKPAIIVGKNEQFKVARITSGFSLQAGGLLEMRLNDDPGGGLLFLTGIFYSQTPLFSSVTGYSNSFPDTLDKKSGNPVTCTTYERSAEVRENIVVKKVEIPLLFKSYLNNWIYLKAGTALGYVTGTSDVYYYLSRTGGGLVTHLATQDNYYIDQDHELDQRSYGYYRDKKYHFPKERFLEKMILSFQFSAGFEKQFNYFSFGMEPNISVGMNPLSARSSPGNYQLSSTSSFNSILESIKMPAFEIAVGFRLVISYLFKN
jgi:hypothetical protein